MFHGAIARNDYAAIAKSIERSEKNDSLGTRPGAGGIKYRGFFTVYREAKRTYETGVTIKKPENRIGPNLPGLCTERSGGTAHQRRNAAERSSAGRVLFCGINRHG
jgi:hypothetical protein